MERKNYNALDICKMVMVTLVVAIHTGPLQFCENTAIRYVYGRLTEMAVPCFFVISGFLLGIRLEEPFAAPGNGGILRSYRGKILKMYLLGMAAYLPLAIWNYIKHGTPAVRALFLYLRGLLWLGQQYNSWHLWYLLGTVYTMCMLIYLWKKGRSLEHVAVCALFIWAINGLYRQFILEGADIPGAWGEMASRINGITGGNWVISAGFYIPLGLYLAKHPLSPQISAAMAVSCGTTMLLLGRGGTAAVVGIVSSLTYVKLEDRPIYPFLRKISTGMYMNHMYAYTVFYFLVYGKKTDGPITFLGTWLLSFLAAVLYQLWKTQRKKRTAGKEAVR